MSYAAWPDACVRGTCLGWLVGEELFEAEPLQPRSKEREGSSPRKRREGERTVGGGQVLPVRRPEAFSLSLNETDEQFPKSRTRKSTLGAP